MSQISIDMEILSKSHNGQTSKISFFITFNMEIKLFIYTFDISFYKKYKNKLNI